MCVVSDGCSDTPAPNRPRRSSRVDSYSESRSWAPRSKVVQKALRAHVSGECGSRKGSISKVQYFQTSIRISFKERRHHPGARGLHPRKLQCPASINLGRNAVQWNTGSRLECRAFHVSSLPHRSIQKRNTPFKLLLITKLDVICHICPIDVHLTQTSLYYFIGTITGCDAKVIELDSSSDEHCCDA